MQVSKFKLTFDSRPITFDLFPIKKKDFKQ